MRVTRSLRRLECQMDWEMNVVVAMGVLELVRMVILMLTPIRCLHREDCPEKDYGSSLCGLRKIWTAKQAPLVFVFVVLRVLYETSWHRTGASLLVGLCTRRE